MGFILFILAMVFLALWISARNAKRQNDQFNYDSGYEDGRQSIIASILKELKDGPLDRKRFDNFLARTNQAGSVEHDEAIDKESFVESVFMPDERTVEEDNGLAIAQPAETSNDVSYVAPKPTKAEQTNRNLNILLYTASFLIIAAAAAFIATNTPALVRLASLWTVISAFYLVGLVLHAKVPFLKPASIAFVGTGLALIPFAGIALSQLGGLSGGWAWCVTSIIGLICYAIATIRLSSNVVGYLTIAFSLSLATSTVAVVSGPMVMYFVVLIVVSLFFHLISHFKPKWAPTYFQRPIEQAGHLLTPITLLGSLVAYDTMTVASYQIVFWVATLYYAVIWVTDRKYVYESAVRILASIASIVTAFDVVDYDVSASLWIILGLSILHLVYSFMRVRVQSDWSRRVETAWYWLILAVLFLSLTFWMSTESMRVGITTQVLVIGLASVAMTLRLRSAQLAIPALLASLAMPFVIGRWPQEELLTIPALTYVFVALAGVILATYRLAQNRSREVKTFLQAAFWFYFVFAATVSCFQGSGGLLGLSALVLAGVVVTASYILRQWYLEIIGAVLVLFGAGYLLAETDVPTEWLPVLVVAATSAIYLLGAYTHHALREEKRRNILIISTLVVGFGLIGGVFAPSETVKIVTVLTSLLFALVALVARTIVSNKVLKAAFTPAYLIYPFLALLAAIGLGSGWFTVIFAIISCIYWAASYIEKNAMLMAFGNAAFVGFSIAAWAWLRLDTNWMLFGITWLTAGVLYASYLVYALKIKDDPRALAQLGFVWAILAVPVLVHLWSSGEKGYAAAATFVAIAATISIHGLILKKKAIIEAGIYVGTFALQRIAGLAAPELHDIVYGHWWALVLGLVAYWRRGDAGVRTRMILAAAALTLSAAGAALVHGGAYQILFLIEHVILLVVGALTRTSWVLWWGLVATVLAVLYFLRSSLFLSLLFLGLTLLGIVVWRLVRAQKKR